MTLMRWCGDAFVKLQVNGHTILLIRTVSKIAYACGLEAFISMCGAGSLTVAMQWLS